jgi:hypothetical protein
MDADRLASRVPTTTTATTELIPWGRPAARRACRISVVPAAAAAGASSGR